MPQAWTTNATLAQIAERLRAARKIVVLTHAKPDGDAVGSTMALVRTLNQPGGWSSAPRAEAWYFGPQPPWLKDIAGSTPHRVVEPGSIPDGQGVDAVAVLDTGSWTQVEAVQEWLAPRREIAVCIDHHVQGDDDIAGMRHIDTKAAAACQPVAELCRLLLGKASISELPREVAEMAYLGLATDTGWFKHSNVSHAVMDTAGLLLDSGVQHSRLYQIVEQHESVQRLKLLARALASLELADKDRVAVMRLTRQDFKETGAQPGDSGGFVDYGQAIGGVVVTCLLTEALPAEYGSSHAQGPLTKISMRSKPVQPEVDVNAVARALGGGGHVRAAGARLAMGLDGAKEAVLREIAKQTGDAAGRPATA